MLLVKAATSFSSLKNSLAYLWLGFAYVCVTTLIVNFSSEHFKDLKGMAPISTLRSVEVSSQVVKDYSIKKTLVFFTEQSFTRGK